MKISEGSVAEVLAELRVFFCLPICLFFRDTLKRCSAGKLGRTLYTSIVSTEYFQVYKMKIMYHEFRGVSGKITFLKLPASWFPFTDKLHGEMNKCAGPVNHKHTYSM